MADSAVFMDAHMNDDGKGCRMVCSSCLHAKMIDPDGMYVGRVLQQGLHTELRCQVFLMETLSVLVSYKGPCSMPRSTIRNLGCQRRAFMLAPFSALYSY